MSFILDLIFRCFCAISIIACAYLLYDVPKEILYDPFHKRITHNFEDLCIALAVIVIILFTIFHAIWGISLPFPLQLQ